MALIVIKVSELSSKEGEQFYFLINTFFPYIDKG